MRSFFELFKKKRKKKDKPEMSSEAAVKAAASEPEKEKDPSGSLYPGPLKRFYKTIKK